MLLPIITNETWLRCDEPDSLLNDPTLGNTSQLESAAGAKVIVGHGRRGCGS